MKEMPDWKINLREKETDLEMTMKLQMEGECIKKAVHRTAWKKFWYIDHSTITMPLASTRISFSGFVIAAISSFDFFASSA